MMPFKLFVLALMLLGLPLLGIIVGGKPIALYLEFPPQTLYVHHAPFSGLVFLCLSLFAILVIFPFLARGLKGPGGGGGPSRLFPLPWWGWFGLLFGVAAWIFAWSRFHWFAKFQIHTFTPLWISFILTINAMTYRRTGRCMLVDQTGFCLLLFLFSALFWWFFEFLNRFVQNWYYTGVQLEPLEYFLSATLPFSTVLPAVMGTREWLLSSPWWKKTFQNFLPIHFSRPKLVAWCVLFSAGVGLAGVGIWPDYLFPLLWMSPFLIITTLQAIFNEPHVFSDVVRGDWHLVLSSAMAALLCGFFWEMWNLYSFAKWEYNLPFVDRFRIFEMPILGYAGYLPFGLECAAVAHLIRPKHGKQTKTKSFRNSSALFRQD